MAKRLGKLQERRLRQLIGDTRRAISQVHHASTIPSKYIGVRGRRLGDSIQWVVKTGQEIYYMAPGESELDAAQTYNFLATARFGRKAALNEVPQPWLEGQPQ